MVLYFAGFQQHYSIYPATARVKRALRKELIGLVHSKGTIRFPLDRAVPTRLIARIAKLRAAGDALAVGVAFAALEVPAVPRDATDQPLDWIVTEREAIRAGATGRSQRQ